jgi:glycine/D-amino acid oxidase-like deaminating enzyme
VDGKRLWGKANAKTMTAWKDAGIMGVTIHYELRFRGGEERVKQVLRQIGEIAANIGFQESKNCGAWTIKPISTTPMNSRLW